MTLLNVLIYLLLNAGLTFCGVMFWLTLENVQSVQIPDRKLQHFWTIVFLAILFSPLVVWFGSLVFRYLKSRELVRTLSETRGAA
jgi:hypothetical protein